LKLATDSRIIIIGIFILSILAAIQERWDIAGSCITGGFALLRGMRNENAPSDNSHKLRK